MDCGWGRTAHSTVEVHFKVEIWGFLEHLRLRSGRNSHLCNDGNIITEGSEDKLQQGRLEVKLKPENLSRF